MTVVATKQGKVVGEQKLGCHQFRGIPFAAPPVGELRWTPPQPAAAWDGERDCLEYSPVCPQIAGGLEQLGARRGEQPPQSEDCLTLNVYTPDVGVAELPVMVWIHGGGFSTGSSRVPWYSGHNFARDGVVCVTINYRLNAFGFLHLDELFDGLRNTGTLGIQDQVAALHWVQDNIAAFGGDPDNVTIFGESAGGMSCGTLLATPSADGTFHRAIPQSGAAHNTHSADLATNIARKFCDVIGVQPGDLDALRAVPADGLLEGVKAMGDALASDHKEVFGSDFTGAAMPFQPTVETEILPQPPIDALRAGAAAGIPVLVGTTAEEWKLFTILAQDKMRSVLPRPLRNLCEQKGRSADDLLEAYRARKDGSNKDLRNAIETDRIFRIPAVRAAEAQVTADTPVWMYRFDWATPAFGGRLGACHAIEIPFVFDNLDAPGADVFTGGEAPQELASAIHSAWVKFASSGDPGWQAYDLDRRSTMVFDTTSKVVDDPDGELREPWEGLL